MTAEDPIEPPEDVESRVQVETVVHRGRVALAFGLLAGALVFGAQWVTKTPRRWVSLLVGAACAAVMYAVLRSR